MTSVPFFLSRDKYAENDSFQLGVQYYLESTILHAKTLLILSLAW